MLNEELTLLDSMDGVAQLKCEGALPAGAASWRYYTEGDGWRNQRELTVRQLDRSESPLQSTVSGTLYRAPTSDDIKEYGSHLGLEHPSDRCALLVWQCTRVCGSLPIFCVAATCSGSRRRRSRWALSCI